MKPRAFAARRRVESDPGSRIIQPSTDGSSARFDGSKLALRTADALMWRALLALMQGTLQFAIGVVLARLLPPADFGLVALAMVVVGLTSTVAELGFGPALIQRADLSERHIRVSFTATTLLGLAVCALAAVLAPVVAYVAQNPALAPVLRALAPLFALVGFGSTARALIQRELRFRLMLVIELGSYCLAYGLIGIPMALSGYGVWSLVAAALVQRMASSLSAFMLTRHACLPLIAKTELADLASFGVGVTLSNAVNYCAGNGDNFVVGRTLGAEALGYYSRAFSLMMLPVGYVALVLGSVMFPAFSRARGQPERLEQAFLISVGGVSLIAGPVMAWLIVSAPDVIGAVYGPAWRASTLPLQILCVGGVFRAVYHLSGALTAASGLVYSEFRRQVVYATLVVVAAMAGSHAGTSGVAVGVVGAIIAMYLMMGRLAVSCLRCGWKGYLRVQLPGILLGSAVAAATVLSRTLLSATAAGSLLRVVVLVGVGVVSSAAGARLLPQSLRVPYMRSRLLAFEGQVPVVFRQRYVQAVRAFA